MTPYERMGGEAGVRRLVDRFYDRMETMPEAAEIRAMHPPDLSRSRLKLFEFLSGWSGGPPLYLEHYGHPRLRARHLPFPIGVQARDQWLFCMNLALEEVVTDTLLRQQLQQAFVGVADHLRNQDG
jgi:hemoglobin